MITPKTQAAIAVLKRLYVGEYDTFPEAYALTGEEKRTLLSQLAAAGLILLKDEENPMDLHSYIPGKEQQEVSLLDILEATGEHLNCNRPTTEEFYIRYGKAAQKLGVVNQITRTYLREITMTDL